VVLKREEREIVAPAISDYNSIAGWRSDRNNQLRYGIKPKRLQHN
jgi:hypothetical protein